MIVDADGDDELDAEVRDEDRPFLVSTRALQEALFIALSFEAPEVLDDLGDVDAPAPDVGDVIVWGGDSWQPQALALDDLSDVDAPEPSACDVLAWNDAEEEWEASELSIACLAEVDLNPPATSGQVLALDDDEWVPQSPNGDLAGTFQNTIVTGLQHREVADTPPDDQQVLTWVDANNQWEPQDAVAGGGAPTGPAGGDLSGNYPNPSVVGLQNQPVSPVAPTINGQVLTWNGAAWVPAVLPAATPTNLEAGLTRIIGMSWPHGGNSLLRFRLDGQIVRGFIVAFGLEDLDDEGMVRLGVAAGEPAPRSALGFLDPQTFQVYYEDPRGLPNGLWTARWIRPGFRQAAPRIIPVRLAGDLTDPTPEVFEVGPREEGGFAYANVVAFVIDDAIMEQVPPTNLYVIIRGDLVVDRQGHALDGEHLRAALPTGDRPRNSPLGTQGGRFESWVRFVGRRIFPIPGDGPGIPIPGDGPEIPVGRLDLNLATLEELGGLPRIGPVLAGRIVQLRNELGGFTSEDELLTVRGLSVNVLEEIRPFIILFA